MSKEITARALRGERLTDLNIFDMHCHYKNSYSYYQSEASMDDMVRGEKQAGINAFCVCPNTALESDTMLGNQEAFEFVQKYPTTVYAYLGLNPNFTDEIDILFDKYYHEDGFLGVKIHPFVHRVKVNDSRYRIVFENVVRRGGYVMSHSWETCQYCQLDLFEDVISTFPEVNIVLAHTGGTVEGVKKTIRLVNKYPNAYLDTCGFDINEHWINELVERCPIEKILFGTDFPFHDVNYCLSRILFADLEDDIKLKILGDNYRMLLGKSPKK